MNYVFMKSKRFQGEFSMRNDKIGDSGMMLQISCILPLPESLNLLFRFEDDLVILLIF